MLCLDTSAVIALMIGRDHRVCEKFRMALERGVSVPIHVAFELWYGVWNSSRVQENSERMTTFFSAPIPLLPFDADDAQEAGQIRAYMKRAGTPIGPYDILIAAQVRRRRAALATLNAAEFARVPGLIVDNWAA